MSIKDEEGKMKEILTSTNGNSTSMKVKSVVPYNFALPLCIPNITVPDFHFNEINYLYNKEFPAEKYSLSLS